MIIPVLSSSDKRVLRSINPHLEAKWNRRFVRWEVWFDAHCGKQPYIVETAPTIDNRLFDSLRHAFWFSRYLTRNMFRMNETAKAVRAKKLKDEEDVHIQLGKEIAPVLRTMKDAGTSSHGRSKTKFQGVDFGKGTGAGGAI